MEKHKYSTILLIIISTVIIITFLVSAIEIGEESECPNGFGILTQDDTWQCLSLSEIITWQNITVVNNISYYNNTIINASEIIGSLFTLNGTSIDDWSDVNITSKDTKEYDIYIADDGSEDYVSIPLAVSTEPAGTTFFIKSGTYVLTDSIQMKQGQQLIGESMESVIIDQNYTTYRLEAHDEVVLKRFSLINGRHTSEQLDISYDDNCVLEEIYMDSGQSGGLGSYISGLMIDNSDNTYINNIVIKRYLYNFKIENSERTRMSNVYSEEAQLYGFRFRNSDYSTINNIICKDDYSAVYFRDSNYAVITNVITQGVGYGFYFYAPSTHNTITNYQGTVTSGFAYFRGTGHDYNTFIGVDIPSNFIINSDYTKVIGCNINDILVQTDVLGTVITGTKFQTLTNNGNETIVIGNSYDNPENVLNQINNVIINNNLNVSKNITIGEGIILNNTIIHNWDELVQKFDYATYFNQRLNTTSNVEFGNITAQSLYATRSTFPVLGFTRETSVYSGNFETTSGIASAMQLVTKTSGSMADAFGGGIVIYGQEAGGTVKGWGRLYARRDGGDQNGALQLWTGYNGASPYLTIRTDGKTGIGSISANPDAGLMVKGLTTNDAFYALKIKNSAGTSLLTVTDAGNINIPNGNLNVKGVTEIIGGLVSNEGGGGLTTDDTRFESDNQNKAFFLDASEEKINTNVYIEMDNDLKINGNLNVTGNITGNFIYGEMWNYTSAGWTFDIDNSDVYYNLTGLTDGTQGFDFENNNQTSGGSNLITKVSGIYKLDFSMSFESIANGGVYGISIAHGFNPDTHRNCYARQEASTEVMNVGITCYMDLEINDKVAIMVENEINNRDIIIYTVNLNLVRIGN